MKMPMRLGDKSGRERRLIRRVINEFHSVAGQPTIQKFQLKNTHILPNSFSATLNSEAEELFKFEEKDSYLFRGGTSDGTDAFDGLYGTLHYDKGSLRILLPDIEPRFVDEGLLICVCYDYFLEPFQMNMRRLGSRAVRRLIGRWHQREDLNLIHDGV